FHDNTTPLEERRSSPCRPQTSQATAQHAQLIVIVGRAMLLPYERHRHLCDRGAIVQPEQSAGQEVRECAVQFSGTLPSAGAASWSGCAPSGAGALAPAAAARVSATCCARSRATPFCQISAALMTSRTASGPFCRSVLPASD